MDEVPIAGHEENWLFKKFLIQYDAPAFARRARDVEHALTALLDRCRSKRAEMLDIVALRLATLSALVGGDWSTLRPLVADDAQLSLLRDMARELKRELRLPIEPTGSRGHWRRALEELCDSLQRFNRRWLEHLERLDLSALNELRDKYNRYYVLEKEFAVRSARVARQGFVPLPPLRSDDITKALPPLPVPRLA